MRDVTWGTEKRRTAPRVHRVQDDKPILKKRYLVIIFIFIFALAGAVTVIVSFAGSTSRVRGPYNNLNVPDPIDSNFVVGINLMRKGIKVRSLCIDDGLNVCSYVLVNQDESMFERCIKHYGYPNAIYGNVKYVPQEFNTTVRSEGYGFFVDPTYVSIGRAFNSTHLYFTLSTQSCLFSTK